MRNAILGLMGLCAVAAIAIDDMFIAKGTEAPAFSGEAPDGTKVSLSEMKGPTFVVFWKQRCPHNKAASAIFNEMKKNYGEKLNFVGLVNTDAAGAKKWTEQFSLNYPLLADADKAVTKAYGLKASIGTFKIEDGKIADVYPGYGKEAMESLNKAMAAAVGKEAVTLTSAMPAGLTWG